MKLTTQVEHTFVISDTERLALIAALRYVEGVSSTYAPTQDELLTCLVEGDTHGR